MVNKMFEIVNHLHDIKSTVEYPSSPNSHNIPIININCRSSSTQNIATKAPANQSDYAQIVAVRAS